MLMIKCIYEKEVVHISTHDWLSTVCKRVYDINDLFFKCRGFILYYQPKNRKELEDMIKDRLYYFSTPKYVVGRMLFVNQDTLKFTLCSECFKNYKEG